MIGQLFIDSRISNQRHGLSFSEVLIGRRSSGSEIRVFLKEIFFESNLDGRPFQIPTTTALQVVTGCSRVILNHVTFLDARVAPILRELENARFLRFRFARFQLLNYFIMNYFICFLTILTFTVQYSNISLITTAYVLQSFFNDFLKTQYKYLRFTKFLTYDAIYLFSTYVLFNLRHLFT